MRIVCGAELTGLATLALVVGMITGTSRAAEKREVPLVFSGGHEIGRNDYGRPVVLIAAALGVTPDQFREAFRGVTPAKGQGPTGAEARKNKAALMKVLGPLGVTNERLDEVSNYYRFRPQNGELWKTAVAKGYAVVNGSAVEKVVVTEPGSGYSTPPKVTVQGMEQVALKATLHLDTDLRKNGSIALIELADAKPAR
jgi:hypothetical protein